MFNTIGSRAGRKRTTEHRKGANIASADILTVKEGGYFHVTGNTSITNVYFSPARNGRIVILEFDGTLTLTHNATTLKLPGGANITTQAGDTACFIQDSGDNVRCAWYKRKNLGFVCTNPATLTVSGDADIVGTNTGDEVIATAGDVLNGTNTTDMVTPDAVAALWEKGADEASAGTVSFGEGGFFHITGTTTITDIDWDTAKDGRVAQVIFDGALTLTHNGTTLQLPGGANITTAAGDRACFVQDSSDNVICLWYQKASAVPFNGNASDTVAGQIEIAVQSEMEAGTDITRAVVPGRQHLHNSACKAWADISATSTTPNASYNVSSVTNGTGVTVVSFTTSFSSANYAVLASVERANDTTSVTNSKKVNIKSGTQAAGSVELQCWDSTATNNVIEDPTSFYMCAFGDHS